MSKNVCEGNRVYYAYPLFNQAKKDDNLKIAYVFENHGYDVFLLRRDGVDGAYLEGKNVQK